MAYLNPATSVKPSTIGWGYIKKVKQSDCITKEQTAYFLLKT